MKKTFLVAISFVLTAACASTPGNIADAGSGSMSRSSATHYILVSDPSLIREMNWGNPPLRLHIKGHLTNAGFKAAGSVEGSGKLCADGQDWVSIADGKFHKADGGVTPSGAYIKGCKGATGGFMPAARDILN